MYVDYEKLEQVYNNINDIIKNMMESIKSSKNIVNKLDSKNAWDGKGYKHYEDLYSNMCTNFIAFCDYMYGINTNIMDSISLYKKVDKKVSETVGNGG